MTEGTTFVARLRDAAEAATSAESVTMDLAPAGVPIRVHFATATLAALLAPALVAAPAGIAPVMDLWVVNGAEARVTMPALPWAAEDYLRREELRGWTTPPRLATIDPKHGTLSVADLDRGYGVQWIRDADALASWEGGAPLRSLLRWALARHNVQMLHGAAVGTAAGGVLLTGPGGSGKSTSALAALQAGMRLIADDYTLVRTGEAPSAHPIYGIAKADRRSLNLLGGFEDRAADAVVDWRGKLRLPIADALTGSMPLRAIVLPTVGEATGSPVRVDRETALRRIVPSTLFQLPGDSAATLRAVRDLLERLPVYTIDVGPEISQIAPSLTAVIDEQVAVA